MNATVHAVNGSRIRYERRAAHALAFRHVQGPRQERIVHDASDGEVRVLELVDELTQCSRAVGPERAHERLGLLDFGDVAGVEAVGDGFDVDVGCGDGVHGGNGGCESGFDAFGGQCLGKLEERVDVALDW